MSVDAIVVLSVLAAAFAAFVSGRVRPDLVAVAGLVALVLGGVVEPKTAFTGFSSFAVITIAGLMVIGVGLERAGVVKWVARQLERVVKKSATRLLVLNTLIPGLLSGFVNIVATATFFISVILRLSKRLGQHASDFLLPMAAALGLVPIAVSALTGAVLMVVLGIVDLEKLYGQIDWRTLILIAGMYPLGVALNDSGAAEVLGDGLVGLLGPLGPLAVLGGVALLAFVLTQPIHNAVVAIIMTPIAIQAAAQVGADPRAFCVAVVVACSATFLMPYGHPAALLVQEPGAYRPADYLRFGAGMSLVVLGVILGVVPLFFPL